VAQGEETQESPVDRSHLGMELPQITLTDAAGQTLDLQSLKGKPLLVNLWATWCAPCIVELPTLDALAGRMEDKVRVLTVSQDMTNTEKVASFLKERGLERLEPWLDPNSDLPFALGGATLPTTILYDPQGKEVWRYVGENDWASEEAIALISETLSTAK